MLAPDLAGRRGGMLAARGSGPGRRRGPGSMPRVPDVTRAITVVGDQGVSCSPHRHGLAGHEETSVRSKVPTTIDGRAARRLSW